MKPLEWILRLQDKRRLLCGLTGDNLLTNISCVSVFSQLFLMFTICLKSVLDFVSIGNENFEVYLRAF